VVWVASLPGLRLGKRLSGQIVLSSRVLDEKKFFGRSGIFASKDLTKQYLFHIFEFVYFSLLQHYTFPLYSFITPCPLKRLVTKPHIHMHSRLLLTLAALLIGLSPAFSQVKKGFKALKQGDPETARTFFEADLGSPTNDLIAQYGLFKASNLDPTFEAWLDAMPIYKTLLEEYPSLSKKQQEDWKNSYGFTKSAVEVTYNSLFSKALNFVDKAKDCEKFKQLTKLAPNTPKIYQKRVDAWEVKCTKPKPKPDTISTLIPPKPLETHRFEYLTELNTAGNEYLPVLSADGETFYFVAKNRSDNLALEDVFISKKLNDSTWSKPVLDTFFSDLKNEVILSNSVDGNQLILFEDGVISTSNRTQTGWSKPKPLQLPSKFIWIGPCSINRNGSVLFFEARQESLMEYIHLYVSVKQADGQWGAPIKLDENINTSGNDRSPFIHSDNKTLYFSSAKHSPNYGNLDVYKVTRLDDTWTKWSKPENLGPEINTKGDEWGFFIPPSGKVAYMSTRSATGYDMDLVKIPLPEQSRPEEQIIVSGSVVTLKGNKVPVKMMIEDAETGNLIDSVMTTPEGDYAFAVPKLKKIRYYAKSKEVIAENKTLVDPSQTKTDVIKQKTKVVSKEEVFTTGINTQSILFEFGKAALLEEGRSEIRRIYESIKDENWKIQINGHTDNVGSELFNQQLSAARAKEVSSFFKTLGYPSAKIQSMGFGSSKPIDSNDTEEGRAKNRRVQIEVLQE
jgi:OmpA-OmpF porin, OOP family